MSITAEKVARPDEAIKNLTEWQEQLDSDGCKVGVSRQALDETLAYLRSVKALLQQGEPEGWKLVRRELTGEQMAAAASVLVEEYNLAAPDDCDRLQEMWEAMLSASPLPPAPGAEMGEKLNIDRDWCIDAAKREEAAGDPDCSVGTFLVPPSLEQEEYLDKVKALGTEYDRSEIISSSRQAALEEAAKVVERSAGRHVALIATEIRALATTPPAEGERK